MSDPRVRYFELDSTKPDTRCQRCKAHRFLILLHLERYEVVHSFIDDPLLKQGHQTNDNAYWHIYDYPLKSDAQCIQSYKEVKI